MKLLVFLTLIYCTAYTADPQIQTKWNYLKEAIDDSDQQESAVTDRIMESHAQVKDEYKNVINQKFENGATPLIYATKNNKLTAVNTLVNAHAHVDSMDNTNHNALWYAIELGNPNLVYPLVLFKEKPESSALLEDYNREQASLQYKEYKQKKKDDDTALDHALKKYNEPTSDKQAYQLIIEHLLVHGAQLHPNVILPTELISYLQSKDLAVNMSEEQKTEEEKKYTLLLEKAFTLINNNESEQLRTMFANLQPHERERLFKSKDADGKTIGHALVSKTVNPYLATLIFDYNIPLNIPNNNGTSAHDIIAKIPSNFPFGEILAHHMTTAHYAAQQGNNALLDTIAQQDSDFKNKIDINGNTPLFYAIKSKNIDTVKKTLETSFGIFSSNVTNKAQETPLHKAAEYASDPTISDEDFKKLVRIMEYLVDTQKVDFRQKNKHYKTALDIFTERAGFKQAPLALSGYTSLARAIVAGSLDDVKSTYTKDTTLVDKKSGPKDLYPLFYAAEQPNKEIFTYILQYVFDYYGALRHILNFENKRPDLLEELLNKIDMSTKTLNKLGLSPLHLIIKNYDPTYLPIIKNVMQKHPDIINFQAKKSDEFDGGETILYVALNELQEPFEAYKDLIATLLEFNPNIMLGTKVSTPLSLAHFFAIENKDDTKNNPTVMAIYDLIFEAAYIKPLKNLTQDLAVLERVIQ